MKITSSQTEPRLFPRMEDGKLHGKCRKRPEREPTKSAAKSERMLTQEWRRLTSRNTACPSFRWSLRPETRLVQWRMPPFRRLISTVRQMPAATCTGKQLGPYQQKSDRKASNASTP